MIQDHFYASGVSEKTVTKVNWFGQTFTPANSFTLKGVALCLRRTALWAGGEYFNVSVYATLAGVPDGVALASKDVLGTGISGSGATPGYPIDFQFDTPLNVTAGTTYVIVMNHTSVNGGMVSVYNSSGGYAGGNYIYSTNSGGSWLAEAGYDFWFELWDNEAELSNNVGNGGNTFAEGSTTTQWVAQWFSLSPDAIACAVVRLCGIAAESSGNVIIEIRDADPITAKPGSIVYGTATVSKSEFAAATRNWFSAVFSPAINLLPDAYYSIVCQTSSGTFTCLMMTSGQTHKLTTDSGGTWNSSGWKLQYQVIRTGAATELPVITSQSPDTIANIGDNIQFFVTATGIPTPTYQWYEGATLLIGETDDTIDVYVDASSDGPFTCEVTNSVGTVTSNPIVLSTYLGISAQSGDEIVPNGSALTLFVTVVGYPILTYEWFKDGAIISGATSSNYLFYPTFALAGIYTCVVTNAAGHVDSDPIVVTVVSNPYTYGFFNVPTDLSREIP